MQQPWTWKSVRRVAIIAVHIGPKHSGFKLGLECTFDKFQRSSGTFVKTVWVEFGVMGLIIWGNLLTAISGMMISWHNVSMVILAWLWLHNVCMTIITMHVTPTPTLQLHQRYNYTMHVELPCTLQLHQRCNYTMHVELPCTLQL